MGIIQVVLIMRESAVYQGFSQDFETISHFCGAEFFFLNMNRQEYNELSLTKIFFLFNTPQVVKTPPPPFFLEILLCFAGLGG